MLVADSDTFIDAMEAGNEPVRNRLIALRRRGELATTAVNVYELVAGARTSIRRLEILHGELRGVVVLPLTHDAAEVAGSVRRYLERKGQGIGSLDYLIAGVCIANDLPLLTRNVRHFSRVPGLGLAKPP